MRRTVDLQKKIFGFWAAYENGSAHQLLWAYARLYGPGVKTYVGGLLLLLSTVIQNKPFDIYIIPID